MLRGVVHTRSQTTTVVDGETRLYHLLSSSKLRLLQRTLHVSYVFEILRVMATSWASRWLSGSTFRARARIAGLPDDFQRRESILD